MQSIDTFRTWAATALILACAVGSDTFAAGLLSPTDGSIPPLTIKEHHVNVVIEDGYAITTVDQTFHNPHATPLEANYSFPVPEKGAVSEFTMWIDGKPVVGEVLEKQQARKIYEEEKAAGNDAGLTEKDGYKTFEVFVSPVRAQNDTRIRLVYLQPAHVDTGIGRYVYPLEEGGVDEQKLAFWTANKTVSDNFSFEVTVRSASPVEAVRLPGRPNAITQQLGNGDWQIRLNNTAVTAGLTREDAAVLNETNQAAANSSAAQSAFELDEDLVVYWRHQAGLPGSVDMITHKPDANGRGTFMLVVTPGDDLKPIAEGRDWVFVLDISGSMQGKYATLADGIERALRQMPPNDRFRIVLFNDRARELTPGFVVVNEQNVRQFSDKVAQISPDNGTNLYAGLSLGLDSLDSDRTSGIVLVTDGVANVGEVENRKFVDLVQKKDVRLFTMVMGNSANRPLLDLMTRESNGFALSISNSDDIVGQLLTATSKVNHEALHDVAIDIQGLKVADLTPKRIGSLYRGQQLVVFGHYWGDGMADVAIDGKVSGEAKHYATRFAFPATATENPEIERLWAFAAIEDMHQEIHDFGEKPDLKQAITDLAVEYGLVTDYTSMLVVDDAIFAKHGIERDNQARVATEQAAREARAQRAAPSRRVDTQQPMYSSSRASHRSGGGALGPWSLLMLLPLVWVMARSTRKA